MRTLTLSILLASLVLSSTAFAQATLNGHPADFDQYPSFLEVTSHLPNNAMGVLRCGYSQTGTTITPDPSYMESTVLNPASNGYARYQRIDNKILITASAPNMAGHFLIQVLEPNSTMAAKNCQMDLNTDSVQGCVNVKPFISAVDATNQDQGAAQQCGSLFTQALPQMDTTSYNLQKTEQFKNAVRQKVAVIEAP